MRASARMLELEGVEAAMAAMATPLNLALMREGGLWDAALERAGPDDLVLAARGRRDAAAILDGVGLGFWNETPRGRIGIVGASGTGIQQLCCLLAHQGAGVSHAIGVGGRDLSPAIGGRMTREAIRRLDEDADTDVIVVVS